MLLFELPGFILSLFITVLQFSPFALPDLVFFLDIDSTSFSSISARYFLVPFVYIVILIKSPSRVPNRKLH